MTDWGLTEEGFHRPSYNELLDSCELKAKALFGSRINLTVRSPLGIFLRIFAWFAGLSWQLAEDVYNSGFIDTAVGVSLARLGLFIGIRKMSARKATGTIIITGDPGKVVPAGFIVQSANNQRFVTLADVMIGQDGMADAPIQAYFAGPDGNVSAGTITGIATPQAAVISVTNLEPTIGGRNRETDAEFKERYLSSVDKPGGSNTDAIRAELLEVPGVAAAVVWENDTDETDGNGLPPHSISAIVYGGTVGTIARAIFKRKAAGIQTYGEISVQLVDASGQIKIVCFSQPEPVPVFVRVTNLVTGGMYGGDDTIRAAIISCIGGDEEYGDAVASGLPIGESVYYNRVICPINKVVGVVDYSLDISIDGATWSKDNIIISARQKAVTSAERIVISA